MSEQKPAEQKAAPAKHAAPVPVLGDAASSTSPVVQGLLAHRAIAVANGDENAAAVVDAQLAELGVA